MPDGESNRVDQTRYHADGELDEVDGELDVVHLTQYHASWTRSIQLKVVHMLIRSLFDSFLLRFFLKLFLESFLKRSNLGR